MRQRLRSLLLCAATVAASTATARAATAGVQQSGRSPAERAFAATVQPISANGLTRNLAGNVGRHVSLVCTVITIVRADSFIGQCGRAAEPVDMYVTTATARLRVGQRLRVLGEMSAPPVWVDAYGHSWYTALVKAIYIDRL